MFLKTQCLFNFLFVCLNQRKLISLKMWDNFTARKSNLRILFNNLKQLLCNGFGKYLFPYSLSPAMISFQFLSTNLQMLQNNVAFVFVIIHSLQAQWLCVLFSLIADITSLFKLAFRVIVRSRHRAEVGLVILPNKKSVTEWNRRAILYFILLSYGKVFWAEINKSVYLKNYGQRKVENSNKIKQLSYEDTGVRFLTGMGSS